MRGFKWAVATVILIIIPLMFSCSVVFMGSITGSVVDKELYDNGDAGSGIAEAVVYLYTDSDDLESDLAAWQADPAILPDNPVEGEPLYFLKTITDGQGDYTFNGFIWNELFPDYGKSGDRKEIFMLFYHKEYGLSKTDYPVYVVSDVTNRIPLFKLTKIMNTAEITGTVLDSDSGDPLPNANIRIWIPETWTYASDGGINTEESSFSWNDSPSYTAVTDDLGEWSQNISYPMLPSSTDNKGTTIIRITYSANGYIAENAADSRVKDSGWDRDGNGSIDSDENDAFFQSGEITNGSYADLGSISLADEYNTAALTGRVINSNTGEGENNVGVRIWVAEEWSYTSTDPADIEAAADVDWPENPDYSVRTDANGEYSADISFERRPSESDNRGTVRVRIVFVKNNFVIDSSSDAKLTDGGWDRDGNGSTDGDEDDAYYDPAGVIFADQQNDLGTIRIKQTEFNETLTGEVWNAAETALVNGVEVWLFYAPVDDDADPATAMETPAPNVAAPDYITSSAAVVNIATSELESGRFSFSGLEWTDAGYTGNQSKVSYYIYLPSAAERASGILAGALGDTEKYYLTAGSANYISLVQ